MANIYKIYSESELTNIVESIIAKKEEEKHPVGSLEFNVNGKNPATYLGFGTWTNWGSGRVPVGWDPSQAIFDSVEEIGGELIHSHAQGDTGSTAITIDQMPVHNHLNPVAADGTQPWGGSTFVLSYQYQPSAIITSEGTHATGGSQGHTHTNPTTHTSSSLQPYIVCYIWKRTK